MGFHNSRPDRVGYVASRRAFLKVAATTSGGLLLSFSFPALAATNASAAARVLSAYILLTPDGIVTIAAGRPQRYVALNTLPRAGRRRDELEGRVGDGIFFGG